MIGHSDIPILETIDVSDPSSPVVVGFYDAQGEPSHMVFSGEHLFLAEYYRLHILQVFQHDVGIYAAQGQSLAVDDGSDLIMRARLASSETAGVDWELSADAGTNWQAFSPEDPWGVFTVPGDDLLWRTTHTWSQGLNPTVSDLTLDWLNEFGPINSVTDIPEDQGGRVLIRLTRSGYDFVDETEYLIHNYNIWLRVDDRVLREDVLTNGESLVADYGRSSSLLTWQGRDYLLSRSGERNGMPPGVWASVGGFPAIQQDEYGFISETLADSTQHGMAWSVFCTTAHTASPAVWFASHPDSGYSVDNLAPGVPTGFIVDHDPNGISNLSWDESADEDFQYFRVYRGDSEDFEIGPETLVHETADTGWIDTEGGQDFFYKITALDFAGNESDPASPEEIVDAAAGVPAGVFLARNCPNPFNPRTTIRFGLPAAGQAHLAVYDMGGRLVRVLASEALPAGVHEYTWDGRDALGTPASSGIYLARLRAGDIRLTQKMVLLK